MNYYNEIDPYAAQWLRNLIDAGHIPPGYVDTRSIEDVTPADLAGYTQCHFFAGIGGWSLALQLAGWPTDRPVWTGSCPCQPFSAAGKGAGFADERHLWPAWFHLIEQCQPPVIFGEQVAGSAVDAWIDLVHADLEGMGYGFASIPFPAAGVGAPHIRDRNVWMADAGSARSPKLVGRRLEPPGFAENGTDLRMADSYSAGSQSREWHDSLTRHGNTAAATGSDGKLVGQRGARPRQRAEQSAPSSTDALHGFWRAADWLFCRDGKWRPVEPGTFPLAHGIPNRVGRLRAYGNAIVPPAIAEFIKAYLACQS